MNKKVEYTYYYEEIPLELVYATINEIENKKRLKEDELKIAMKCSSVSVFITLELKNGKKVYVARKKTCNNEIKNYEYKVQLLADNDDDELEVLTSADYTEKDGKYFTKNGDSIIPLFMIAVKIIRLNKRKY